MHFRVFKEITFVYTNDFSSGTMISSKEYEKKYKINDFLNMKERLEEEGIEFTDSWDELYLDYTNDLDLINRVQIKITNSCNLNCPFCFSKNEGKYILYNQFHELLDILKENGVIFITLTGGEVFTHPNIMEMLNYLDEQGFIVQILSNGTLIDKVELELINDLSINHFGISVYDEISYLDSSFRSKVIQNIETLLSIGFSVKLTYKVTIHNYMSLESVYDLVKHLLDFENFELLFDPRIINYSGSSDYRLRYNDLRDILVKFLVKKDLLPRPWFREDIIKNNICYLGVGDLYCDLDGEISLCTHFPESLGNIFVDSFEVIVENKKTILKKLKKYKFEKCKACDLKQFCDSCICAAFYENGSYDNPSQHICDITRSYYGGSDGC